MKTALLTIKQPIVFLILILPLSLQAQSLFDNSLSESNLSQEAKYKLGGYFRGGVFGDENEIKEKYAEGALKLDITGNQYGNAYAEMRYRTSDGICRRTG